MDYSVNAAIGRLEVGELIKVLSIELDEPILLQVGSIEDGPAEGGKMVGGKVADKPAVLYLYPGKHDPINPFDSIGDIELDIQPKLDAEEEQYERFKHFLKTGEPGEPSTV